MKTFLTLFLSLFTLCAISQSPRSLTEYASSGLPLPEGEPSEIILDRAAPPPGVTFYTDRSVFDAAYPGLPVEDFENSSIAGIVSFPSPLDESTNNAYFNPGDILPGIQFTTSGGTVNQEIAGLGAGVAGNLSKTIIANTFIEDFQILFSPATGQVGMDVQSFFIASTCEIDIYDALGGLITSTTAPGSNAGTFWGVASDTPIGKIVINSTTDQAEGADNIAFDYTPPVPLSDWAIYAGILLIAVFMVVRYRRNLAVN